MNHLKATVSSLQQQITSLQNSAIAMNNTNTDTIPPNTTLLNTTTTNTTYNDFGHESCSHIDNEFIEQCIENRGQGVRDLIERIHFSADVPANHNIRIQSLKNNLVEVLQNKKWVIMDANEAIEKMINKWCRLLTKFYFDNNNDLEMFSKYVKKCTCEIMDTNNNKYHVLRMRLLLLVTENSNGDDV